jgi:hypothetical protein
MIEILEAKNVLHKVDTLLDHIEIVKAQEHQNAIDTYKSQMKQQLYYLLSLIERIK